MQADAQADQAGYVHDVAFYDSEQRLLDLLLPHLAEAAASGEPVFLALQPAETALVRSAIGHDPNAWFLPTLTTSARPPAAIHALRRDLEAVLAGVDRIRAVTMTPHPGLGARWAGWRRYESAVNELLADLPVWGLCLYDLRVTPPHVVEDVWRTHPHITIAPGDHRTNDRYEPPRTFLSASQFVARKAHEAATPDVELVEPDEATGRQAVAAAATTAGLAEDAQDSIVLATSEVVTNARVHGRPPVRLRIWQTPGAVSVHVSDRGPGPADPLAGLRPPDDSSFGGRGLWLAHQLVELSTGQDDDGYTVELQIT